MDALAQQVKEYLKLGHRLRRRGLAYYRAAGAVFAKAQAECERRDSPHYRKFGIWLTEKAEVHPSTAYAYIALAKLPAPGNLREAEAQLALVRKKAKKVRAKAAAAGQDAGQTPVADARVEAHAGDHQDDAAAQGRGAPVAGKVPAEVAEAASQTGHAVEHGAGDGHDLGNGGTPSRRNNAKDPHTVPLTIAHGDYPRWREMIEFAKKDLGVDNDSDAVFRALEEYVRGRGRG
jgi:hypothetical protein